MALRCYCAETERTPRSCRGLQSPGRDPIEAATTPEASLPRLRGRRLDRPTALFRPGIRADGLPHKVLGTTPDHRPRRNPSDARGVTDPLPALPSQGAARAGTLKSGGPQRRSFCTTGGWHSPMALLVAAGAGCRSCCRTIWRTRCSLGDPARSSQPYIRTKAHPTMGQSCTRYADKQAEIHRSGP
jgi:hypothetical protein